MNPRSFRISIASRILASVAAAACMLSNRSAPATPLTPLPPKVSASVGGLGALPAGLVPAIVRTLAADSTPSWQAQARGHGALVFYNPAQQLSARFSRQGMRLQLGSGRHEQLGMRLLALRSGNISDAMTAGSLSAQGTRLDIAHGHGLTEWYVNSPLGLEQGFTLAEPLRGGDSLALVFRLQGNLTPKLNGNVLEFYSAQGQRVLRYGKLLAYDAQHRPLPASLRIEADKLLIAVHTTGAVWPVTVDPLFSAVTTFNDPLAAADDLFASSVAISNDGNTILIGAPGVTVSGQLSVGTAYIFTRTNGLWSGKPIQAFADPGAHAGDAFGYSVALSGDGNTAIIGAPGTSVSGRASAGTVYLYSRSNGTWSSTPVQVFADPGSGSDDFGYMTALSADGNTLLVGAPYTGAGGNSYVGAAYIYAVKGGVWPSTPTQTLTDPSGAAKDYFGEVLALSANGTEALIGADGATVSGSAGAGAAYLYVAANGAWPNSPSTTWTDPQSATYDRFGYGVALSGDGGTALIGAYATTVASISGAGAAYLYTQTSGAWSSTPVATFTEPAPGSGDYFGYATALSYDGKTAVIGAPNTTVSGNKYAGAAYGYTQVNGAWSNKPVENFPGQVGSFGGSLALSADGTVALIGADAMTVSGASNAGAASLFASPTDLSLALSSSPATVTAGQSVTYLLTVSNNDTQVTASNVTITDTLPAGMTFLTASSAGGTCNNTNGTVSCTLASLAPQASWQPSITVNTGAAGSITDTATVAANQPDPNTANNTASATTTVSNPAGGGSTGGGGGLGTLALLFLSGLWFARDRLGPRNKSRAHAS